ncbi:PA2778 family cysteine peptidase [Roseateles violae]|uniref:PA2778 family cysteine peptidase n=1 Tax=Roseateles violae TaxID=3058042 RepID=A0ABT8DU95_9BURK|nr:PA2778 family cysteine peptidase [Pelomonas sp. PFR6]MDN3919952.1 PA2778 family cysteine peptidase [Pelomonas sp. PFR6]
MKASGAALTLAAALLAGCASAPPQLQRLNADWPAALPPRVELTEAPFFAQDEHQCGPAALAMLLQAAGVAVTPAQLLPAVYLPGRQGSLQQELLAATRRHGLPAYRLAPQLDALLRELAAGHPVLVFQNLSLPVYPVWHYALAIGYDRARGSLILHSGREARSEISLAAFERTWARAGHWALLALPPEQLPATAGPAAATESLAALERLDAAAARRGYAAALGRWPAEPLLLLGAGNSAHAGGDLEAAEAAYRAAVQARPGLADGWNNLAQVLIELGRPDEARAAIEHALALGGPRQAAYRELARRLPRPAG